MDWKCGMVPGCLSFDTLNQLGHQEYHQNMVHGSRLPADQSPRKIFFKKKRHKELLLFVFSVLKSTEKEKTRLVGSLAHAFNSLFYI